MRRLALLAVAGLLLAGCGGSGRLSKSAYQQHLQADGKTVQASITALTKVSPTSLAQFATRVDAAEVAVKKAADDLGSLKPPSDAAADNAAIVTAFRAIQTALERVKANPTAAAAIVSRLQASPELKAAEKATTDLTSKGYNVGVIGAP